MTDTLRTVASETGEFLPKYLKGSRFKALYNEVMAIVERCAAYLDGPGRQRTSGLDPASQTDYARTSMWLTIGLMRIASVMLVLKSVGSGEMGVNQGLSEIEKTKAARRHSSDHEAGPGVPEELVQILGDYRQACGKVERLAAKLAALPSLQVESPMASWLESIEREFCLKRQAQG